MLFKSSFTCMCRERCLTHTVPAEVEQAGVSGPVMNAQKQLSCQEMGTEGHGDTPDLNTEQY